MEVLILIPLSHGAGQISIAALVFFFFFFFFFSSLHFLLHLFKFKVHTLYFIKFRQKCWLV